MILTVFDFPNEQKTVNEDMSGLPTPAETG